MRRTGLIAVLALLAALVATASPLGAAQWRCEGRVCATGMACCCAVPSRGDAQCRVDSARVGAASVACPAGCRCEVVAGGGRVSRLTTRTSLPIVFVWTLPAPDASMGLAVPAVAQCTSVWLAPPIRLSVIPPLASRAPPTA
jgi:hypothetical protein